MENGSDAIQQVGINAHLLSRQATFRSAGIHGYIGNVLERLTAVPEGAALRYTVYVGEGTLASRERMKVVHSAWPTGQPLVRILWEQLMLPWQSMDLLYSTAFVTPLAARWPTVVTIYDLSFLHHPKALSGARRGYLRLFSHLSCRRARRIIAISESTRRDLVKQWGIAADKIDVAYPGVGEQFRPLPEDEVEAFRARQGLPPRFILHLGTLEPRKNLVRLIQAFARLKTDAKLVLAGGRGWLYDEITAEIERLGLQDRVVLPGYIADEALCFWYNAASVLAYPSLYEGFGLPVIEAMACGTPVVTSTASSLPEAAGEAGLLVDPHDIEMLAEALQRALTDEVLQEEMRKRGLSQAARFTWEATAATTVATLCRALGTNG
jgi:glycosyltransferase involved in cell wall biosynthesis